MNWNILNSESQLQEIVAKSQSKPQVIFKHSIRCSVSAVIKDRLERKKQPADIDFYYLDLINYRDISNKVARDFGVDHESPQVLLIKNGVAVYDESHLSIRMDEITAQAM